MRRIQVTRSPSAAWREVSPRTMWHGISATLISVLKFFIPGHLYGFELGLVRRLGIGGKVGKLGYVAMQVGETHFERILVRKFIGQLDGDVFGAVPAQIVGH